MAKKLYFATDKNIYDALHHKRITAAKLHELLLNRGVFLSPELDKEILIEEISKLPHGFNELEHIKKLVKTYDPRESTTSVNFQTSTNQAELKSAAEALKKTCSPSKGQSLNIVAKKDGSLTVEYKYEEIDLSKTALRQIDKRNIIIELRPGTDKVEVRMPQNPEAKKVIESLQNELSKIKSEPIERFEISLLAITDPTLRSQFFQELMNGLRGYETDDVTKVELNRSTDASEDEDKEETIDTGFVKKAVLNGEGVNSSAIFSQLHEKGYYIGRIAWSSKPTSGIGDRINVEAFFKDSEKCCDFAYQIKGINNQKEDGFNVTIRAATAQEKKHISELIESAAENAYNLIIGSEVNEDEKG
ncbi:TPA: hypothetical protein ACKFV5_003406 [Enterobacter roggenkampii]|nr:hypothetical protein [Enterobacter asburiae]HCM9479639.1 hypothetical protein [Enterobacter roggenkampii]